MDRAEQAGLGAAVVGHVVLFGLLSVGFLATPNPLDLKQRPIEVTLSDEVGLESQAPVASQEEPAPKLAEEEGPVEPTPPPPPEPMPAPQPVPKPTPAPPVPTPKPVPKAVAKPAPPKPKPVAKPQAKSQPKAAAKPPAQAKPQQQRQVRPTGRLAGLMDGLTDRPSQSRSTTPPAAAAGPAVLSSLRAEVLRQLKPHWRSPTGADVELLRTVVEVRLARDGTIIGEPRVIAQTGVNDSNRSQAALHKERAIRATELAAPFKLPAEFYESWKVIKPAFDKRL